MTALAEPAVGSPAVRIREVPWHPVILAVTIVVTFWLETSVHPLAVFRSLAIAAGSAGLLTVLLALVMRDRHVAGAIALGLVLALWSRHLVHLVSAVGSRMPELWQSIAWYSLVGVAALIAGRLALRRIRKGWRGPGFTRGANLLALALLVMTVVAATTSGALGVAARDLGIGEAPGVRAVAGGGQVEPNLPDMYVILLDGYPRADVAETRLGHDNSDFISTLDGLGFDVAAESHSDYLFTQLSVPSLLNMAYIEQVPELLAVHEAQAPLHPTVRRVLNDNPVFALIRKRGYEVMATASGFEHYALRDADAWLDGGQMNEFELQLLASTYAGPVVQLIAPDLASSAHRDRVLASLARLPEIAASENDRPRFVFAHIPSPHQPAVFGADGEPVRVPITGDFYDDSSPERGQTVQEFTAAYVAQLEYINEVVLDTVRGILEGSVEEPVILLLSDHGTSSRVTWIGRNPAESDPVDVLERTGTLFAAYTPGHSDVFPDDVSPASVFRHLFDAYFGTTYGTAEPPEGGGYVPPVDASVLRNQD